MFTLAKLALLFVLLLCPSSEGEADMFWMAVVVVDSVIAEAIVLHRRDISDSSRDVRGPWLLLPPSFGLPAFSFHRSAVEPSPS